MLIPKPILKKATRPDPTVFKPKRRKLIPPVEPEAPAVVIPKERQVIFEPNPGPQTDFLAATEKEVFYGGARGGGKSYSLIVDPLRYCHKEMAHALIIRRTMPELRDLIDHSHRLYPKAFPGATWREKESMWRFPAGARVSFGYAETAQDALRYQGKQYTWIGIDELPQYPDQQILNDLRGSLRSVDPEIPEYMRFTGNPGNVGSVWVRDQFINAAPWNTRFNVEVKMPDNSIEYITRRFIPAKLTDNPYLTRTNSYRVMLASLPETKRRQWLEGDWDVFDGAAFSEFRRDTHVVEPRDLPSEWPRFRAMDWGYSSPSCVLWFAVDNDGNLIVYRELYFQGLTADLAADKILQAEEGDRVRDFVLDSSAWQDRGTVGPSIAETMIKRGCRWRPSDRSKGSRVHGKLEVHRRLATYDVAGTRVPRLTIFSTCKNLIRTLPLLTVDENNPEDVNTKLEDHPYDALRYGCMSRPLSPQGFERMLSYAKETYRPVDSTFGY